MRSESISEKATKRPRRRRSRRIRRDSLVRRCGRLGGIAILNRFGKTPIIPRSPSFIFEPDPVWQELDPSGFQRHLNLIAVLGIRHPRAALETRNYGTTQTRYLRKVGLRQFQHTAGAAALRRCDDANGHALQNGLARENRKRRILSRLNIEPCLSGLRAPRDRRMLSAARDKAIDRVRPCSNPVRRPLPYVQPARVKGSGGELCPPCHPPDFP